MKTKTKPVNKKEKDKKQEPKHLFIELTKDINLILRDYCKSTNTSIEDIRFVQGYLQARLDSDDVSMDQLLYLQKIYFFTGVYYAKTTKGFKYAYLSKKESEMKIKELKKKVEHVENMFKSKETRPSYMG